MTKWRTTRLSLTYAQSSSVHLTENEAKVRYPGLRVSIRCSSARTRCFVNALLNWKSPKEILSPKRVFGGGRLADVTGSSKERDDENGGTPLPAVAKGDELLCERGSGRAPNPAAASFHRCDIVFRDDRNCPLRAGVM